jgi:hypothetical protein
MCLCSNFYLLAALLTTFGCLSPHALEEVRAMQIDSAITLQEGADTWSYPWGGTFTSN